MNENKNLFNHSTVLYEKTILCVGGGGGGGGGQSREPNPFTQKVKGKGSGTSHIASW